MDKRFYTLIAILALSLLSYFINLGASSLWDANEAFYAETPREMIETGDFINPSFNYQPRFNKPPLCYWIVAAFYKLFGVSETTERLPLALAAIILVATAFFLARVAYSTEAGLFAAVALATLPRFLMFSRRIMIDVYLAMFMGLALLFFALAEKQPARRKAFLVMMYIAIGLGVMTKGPVAIVLPALTFFIYFAVTRQLHKVRRIMPVTGALILVAIVLPWYGAVYLQHGSGYIETFLLQDNFSRYSQPIWGPHRSIFFYVRVILGDLFPWSLLLFLIIFALLTPAILQLVQRLKTRPANSGKENTASPSTFEQHPHALLLLIWILVIVIFYSLSQNKEDLYISPIYTAATALIGISLARFTAEKTRLPDSRDSAASMQAHNSLNTYLKFFPALLITGGFLIVLSGVAVIYLFGSNSLGYQIRGATAIGSLAILGGTVTQTTMIAKKCFAAITSLALTFAIINVVFVSQTLPDVERFKPVPALCEVIKTRADTDALIGNYKVAVPSMVYYLRRPIFEYGDTETNEFIKALSSGRNVYCLMNRDEYESIKATLPVETHILASHPVFQVKLKSILDRREFPQVVLITNQLE